MHNGKQEGKQAGRQADSCANPSPLLHTISRYVQHDMLHMTHSAFISIASSSRKLMPASMEKCG
eukprot:1159421-Pelagomonas_calceolata.AAC.16